jgi:hypothetical protein
MSVFCFLFWHRWRPQATEQITRYRSPAMREISYASEFATRVLYRCTRCPRHRVGTLDGHWTLEQLVLGEEMHDSPRVTADH